MELYKEAQFSDDQLYSIELEEDLHSSPIIANLNDWDIILKILILEDIIL